MQTLNELLKRNIISDLILRDISNSISIADYNTIDEGLTINKIDNKILKNIRSELFGISPFAGEIIIDRELLKVFGQEICREYMIIPLKSGIIGILDPENKSVLKSIQDISFKAKV